MKKAKNKKSDVDEKIPKKKHEQYKFKLGAKFKLKFF